MTLGKLNVHLQKMKLDPYLSPCKKIDSKWIKLDLNMKTEPVRTNGCILHDKDV